MRIAAHTQSDFDSYRARRVLTMQPAFYRVLLRFLAASALAVTAGSGLAQDYIDVEAERRAAEYQRVSTSTSAMSNRIGGALAAGVTTTLPPPSAPCPAQAADVGGLFNQVLQLQGEVMRLNGVVEQLSYELRQLREQSLERYLDLDKRLAEGGGAPASGTATGNTGGSSVTPTTPPRSGARDVAEQPGEGEAYRAAYALVRGQEFDSAVDAFNGFLERFPDGRYAPNAHYWLGELYLVVQPMDAEAARQSFMLLLTQYPDNAKVPDALFKLGRVHYIKGNSDRAREFLDRVIREYPNSPAARLAGDFKDQNL